MIDAILLTLVSMIVGGAIVSHAGMKGLSVALIGICLMIGFYGGKLGILVGAIGILSILLLWFLSNLKKPISLLYNAKSQSNNKNNRCGFERKLSEDYRRSFQAGLMKKYPEKIGKVELIDKLRKNLRSGLAERYPEKERCSNLRSI